MTDEPSSVMNDPEGWLRQQESTIAALRASAERARAELAEAEIEVTSRNRAVTVTVNPSGVLLDLVATSHADRLSPTQLTESVMEAYREACAEATAHTRDIMADLVGDDSDAMAFLEQVMPADDEDGGTDRG